MHLVYTGGLGYTWCILGGQGVYLVLTRGLGVHLDCMGGFGCTWCIVEGWTCLPYVLRGWVYSWCVLWGLGMHMACAGDWAGTWCTGELVCMQEAVAGQEGSEQGVT